MKELARWLQNRIPRLTEVAVTRLAVEPALRTQTAESITIFFASMLDAAQRDDIQPVKSVVKEWAQTGIVPGTETTNTLNLMLTLKYALWDAAIEQTTDYDTIVLMSQADHLFNQATILIMELERARVQDIQREEELKTQSQILRLNQSKSNFIAIAAHELRTPITVIHGYVDILAGQPLLKEDPQMQPLCAGVKQGTHRLLEIVNDLLDVAQLDLRIMKFHFQPVWLRQILQKIERTMRPVAEERSITLSLNLDSIPSEPTYGDLERLQQVLRKIISNAVKYTPNGGKVTVTGRQLPGFTDLTVEDSGIGISANNLPKIFDAFSALDNIALHSSSKTKFMGGGAGLGLPIAKGIMQAHGGNIWAESDGYDEQTCPGSTFHIIIPMQTIAPIAPLWNTPKETPEFIANTLSEGR